MVVGSLVLSGLRSIFVMSTDFMKLAADCTKNDNHRRSSMREFVPLGLLFAALITGVKTMPMIFRWRHRHRVLRIREESARLFLEALLSRRYRDGALQQQQLNVNANEDEGDHPVVEDSALRSQAEFDIFHIPLNSVIPRATKDELSAKENKLREAAAAAATEGRDPVKAKILLAPQRFAFHLDVAKDESKSVQSTAVSTLAMLIEYESSDVLLVVDVWNVAVAVTKALMRTIASTYEESLRNGEGGTLPQWTPSALAWARILQKKKYRLDVTASLHFQRLLAAARAQVPGLLVEPFEDEVLCGAERTVRAHRSYWAQLKAAARVATSIISMPRLALSSLVICGLYSFSSYTESRNGVWRYSDLHGERELAIFAEAASAAHVGRTILQSLLAAAWRAVSDAVKMCSSEVLASVMATALSSYVMLDVNMLIETDTYMALAVQDLEMLQEHRFVWAVQCAVDDATTMSSRVGSVLGDKVTSVLSLVSCAAYPLVTLAFIASEKLMDGLFFTLNRTEFIMEFANSAYGAEAQGRTLRSDQASVWYHQMKKAPHHNPLFSDDISAGDSLIDVDTTVFPQLERAVGEATMQLDGGGDHHLRGVEDARIEYFARAPFNHPPRPTVGLILLVDAATSSSKAATGEKDHPRKQASCSPCVVWLQLAAQCQWPAAPNFPLAVALFKTLERITKASSSYSSSSSTLSDAGTESGGDDVILSRLCATKNVLRRVLIFQPPQDSTMKKQLSNASESSIPRQEPVHQGEEAVIPAALAEDRQKEILPLPAIKGARAIGEMQKQLRSFGMDKSIAQLYALQIRDDDDVGVNDSDNGLASNMRQVVRGIQKLIAQGIGTLFYAKDFEKASHLQLEMLQADADSAAQLLLPPPTRVYPWVRADCGECYYDAIAENYAMQGSAQMPLDLSSFQTISNVTARTQKIDRTHAQLYGAVAAASVAVEEEILQAPFSVEFRNVSFRYKSGAHVLRNVSFAIKAGEFVGIVGETGGGKTTLLRLLLRLHQPTSGQIFINGKDIAEFPVRQLRRRIAYVCQQACLDDEMTIEGNIAIGDLLQEDMPHAVDQALRLAEAADFVAKLPLKTKTRGNGEQLSGGEQQRINIARALVKDRARVSLYVLDEATSAVDVETERHIQSAIMSSSSLTSSGSAGAGRVTCMAIAHRLSTVRHADRIIVIDEGRVAQVGTWDELEQEVADTPTIFQRLVAAQEVRRWGGRGDDGDDGEEEGAMSRIDTGVSTNSDFLSSPRAAAGESPALSRSAKRRLRHALEVILSSDEQQKPDVKERAALVLKALTA